jgi:hypothetical protein
MLTIAQLAVEVNARLDKAEADLERLNKKVESSGSLFSGLPGKVIGAVGSFVNFAGSLSMATQGVEQLVGVAENWIQDAEDATNNQNQLNAVLKSTHDAVGLSADQINDLTQKLKNLTGVDDDVILSGENMLLTFTNIGSSVFPLAAQAMEDMAVKMNNGKLQGLDMKDAAIQLGKALNDPIQGISALTRVGVTFTDQQKQQIEQMVKSGDTAGAQKLILQELEREFGGVAQAAGNSDPLNKFKLIMGDIGKTVGGVLLPPLQTLNDKVLVPVGGWIQDHINPAMHDLGGLLDDLKTHFLQAFDDKNGEKVRKLKDLGKELLDKLKDLGGWVKDHLISGLQGLAGAAGNVASWVADLKQHIKDANDWFHKWEPEILTVGGIITTYFLPAIIASGVQSSIAAGKIGLEFVSNIVKAGVEAFTASGKLWLNAGSFVLGIFHTGDAAKTQAANVDILTASEEAAGVTAETSAGQQDMLAASEEGVGTKAVASEAVQGLATAEEAAGTQASIAAPQLDTMAASEAAVGTAATEAAGAGGAGATAGAAGGAGLGIWGLAAGLAFVNISAADAAEDGISTLIDKLTGLHHQSHNPIQDMKDLWTWVTNLGDASSDTSGNVANLTQAFNNLLAPLQIAAYNSQDLQGKLNSVNFLFEHTPFLSGFNDLHNDLLDIIDAEGSAADYAHRLNEQWAQLHVPNLGNWAPENTPYNPGGGGGHGGGHPHAMGGPTFAGVPYLVGEEGRETFIPDQNGWMLTHAQTEHMLAQSQPKYEGDTYNFNGITSPRELQRTLTFLGQRKAALYGG